jgi:YebC/PmpR family DNA-binding regulatory protein
MAGHSHAANVAHRKAAQGKKKAKLFTQILRLVYVAVKQGGSDEAMNSSLRFALEKARSYSVPKDKIKATIDRASGNAGEAENYEDMRYDGYAAHGIGVIVQALTDNRNRTASEVRAAFTKFGGNLGESGSLDFFFKRQGVIYYKKALDFDALFEVAVELDADSVEKEGDYFIVYTSFENFHKVQIGLERQFGQFEEAEIEYAPQNTIALTPEQKQSVQKLLDALEELEDVQNVWSNLE